MIQTQVMINGLPEDKWIDTAPKFQNSGDLVEKESHSVVCFFPKMIQYIMKDWLKPIIMALQVRFTPLETAFWVFYKLSFGQYVWQNQQCGELLSVFGFRESHVSVFYEQSKQSHSIEMQTDYSFYTYSPEDTKCKKKRKNTEEI